MMIRSCVNLGSRIVVAFSSADFRRKLGGGGLNGFPKIIVIVWTCPYWLRGCIWGRPWVTLVHPSSH